MAASDWANRRPPSPSRTGTRNRTGSGTTNYSGSDSSSFAYNVTVGPSHDDSADPQFSAFLSQLQNQHQQENQQRQHHYQEHQNHQHGDDINHNNGNDSDNHHNQAYSQDPYSQHNQQYFTSAYDPAWFINSSMNDLSQQHQSITNTGTDSTAETASVSGQFSETADSTLSSLSSIPQPQSPLQSPSITHHQQQQSFNNLDFYAATDFTTFDPAHLFVHSDNANNRLAHDMKPDLAHKPILQVKHESGKRPKGTVADTLSSCWTSPLCPDHRSSSSTPEPSSCGAACGPYLFRDIPPLPSNQKSEPIVAIESSVQPDIGILCPDSDLTNTFNDWDHVQQSHLTSMSESRTTLKRGNDDPLARRTQITTLPSSSTAGDHTSPTERPIDKPREHHPKPSSKASTKSPSKPPTKPPSLTPIPTTLPTESSTEMASMSGIGDDLNDLDPDDPKARKRQPHKQVERKYRESLNAQLESLRRVVPALQQNNRVNMNANFVSPATLATFSGMAPCNADIEDLPPISLAKPSKAVILATATAYIQHIEQEKKSLTDENDTLRLKVKALQALVKCDDCSLLQYVMNLKIQPSAEHQNMPLPPPLQQIRQRQQLQQQLLAPSP